MVKVNKKQKKLKNITDIKQRLEKVKRELSVLHETSKVISSLDLNKFLDTIVEKAVFVFDCEIGSILLLDKRTNKLKICAARGLKKAVVRNTHLEIGSGISGWVFKNKKSLWVDDIEKDSRFKIKSNGKSVYYNQSFISSPLKVKDKVIGVLNVNNKRNRQKFSKDDMKLLEVLASQSAMVIHNAQLLTNLQQEKEKILAIFNGMGDGAVVTDGEYNILMLNSSAETIFNINEEQVIDKKFPVIIDNFTPSIPWEELESSKERVIKFNLVRNKGKNVFLSTSLTKTIDHEDDSVTAQIMIFRDATEEKKEDRLKKNFLSTISHKLRSPLTIIVGYISLLTGEEDIIDKLNAKQNKMLTSIEKEALLLSDLVDKLLRFNLLQTEPLILNKEKANLSSTIKFALKGLGQIIKINKVDLIIDSSVLKLNDVYIDKIRMEEAFSNLIENAIKFISKEDKKILIKGYQIDDNFIQLEIKDNGPGIHSEEQEKIFQKFYQIEEYFTGLIDGAGLGLSLVRQIVESHGGKIWVKSKLGEGSTFYVTLPVWVQLRQV